MKKIKIIKTINSKIVLLVILFLVSVFLDYKYGSLIYSKVLQKEKMYEIGRACQISRLSCEQIYFKDHLKKINMLSNTNRNYFSNIFIKENQKDYTGNCPCPYNTDTRGGSCGGRSSYSKENGVIKYCYDEDVSDKQIETERATLISEAEKELEDAVQSNLKVYNEKYTLLLIIIFYSSLIYITWSKGKRV